MSITSAGLSPAISIEQKTTSKNPRSTVGTVTEIYDYHAPVVRPRPARPIQPGHRPAHRSPAGAGYGRPRSWRWRRALRAYLLAPIVRDRKGEYRKEFLELRKQGFQRVKVDGAFYDLDEPPTLDKKFRHDIDVVVDRLVVQARGWRRGWRTVPCAPRWISPTGSRCWKPRPGTGTSPERITFSARILPVPVSGFTIPEIEPRLFSFNAPFGACPDCDGLGVELFFRRTPRGAGPDPQGL